MENQARIGSVIEGSVCDVEPFLAGVGVGPGQGTQGPETGVVGDDILMAGRTALAYLNDFPDDYERGEEVSGDVRLTGLTVEVWSGGSYFNDFYRLYGHEKYSLILWRVGASKFTYPECKPKKKYYIIRLKRLLVPNNILMINPAIIIGYSVVFMEIHYPDRV
ncbi:MAG: hypothetical protein PHP59_08565 [Methanofollis sp.]|uniref:hypothetical protein n=1 Tax=Methanofollis sp. TaxID=2052835 RepID=UPI0026342488|nr:hypothetical protein [Methanofollis sp.]MDD4255412.1 hypothetical protein [Methanofollis sp.]